MKNNIFDEKTLRALKDCITGLTTTETVLEYAKDEETGDMKLVKKKVQEKTLPPNIDLLKLVYQHLIQEEDDYEKMSDDQLEKEKQKLLKELKEKESDCRKSKSKSKM